MQFRLQIFQSHKIIVKNKNLIDQRKRKNRDKSLINNSLIPLYEIIPNPNKFPNENEI